MKLTVLGKYGPYPASGGGTSSYLVQGQSDAVVLDFGSGALGRLQRILSPTAVRAVILSHLHYDHICDLLPLSYALAATGRTLPLVYPDVDCVQRTLIEDLDGFRRMPLKKEMQMGEFTLTFEKMVHPLESYAVKVKAGGKTLFYSGDTAFCPQLPVFARGSDLLLLDCGKAENTAAPHLSLAEAERLATELSVPVLASHLHPAHTYASENPLVTLAEEGKTYTV